MGNLRRNAYTLTIGANSSDIARYERRGVKVISLPGKAYNEVFSRLFQELRDYWSDKLLEKSTFTTEESHIELALPRNAKTRLCFFAIPNQFLTFYRNYVFPIFERYGFTPIISYDVISPGENILAKVSSLMDRATLVVADVSSSSWVNSEIDMALIMNRKIVLIIEEGASVPGNIRDVDYNIERIIDRPKIMDPKQIDLFLSQLDKNIQDISRKFIDQLSEEPITLLEKREPRAAVISAISLLESELREKLLKNIQLDYDLHRLSLRKLLEVSMKYEYTSPDEISMIQKYIFIRNKLVHTNESISYNDAQQIVNDIMELLQTIRQRND